MKYVLQIYCIVLTSMGIAVELVTGAGLGYLLITIGSFAFAVACKIIMVEKESERNNESKFNPLGGESPISRGSERRYRSSSERYGQSD